MRLARESAEWAAQILVLIFATTAVAMPCVIPSGSMEGTLMTGDHVIVDRLAYAPHGKAAGKALPYEEVQRGDIVVFRYPLDIRQNYVKKRVIGTPGDRVRMENGAVIRNGVRVNEPYVQHLPVPYSYYRDNFPLGDPAALVPRAAAMVREYASSGQLVVPDDQYFVTGDNRDNSEDSRYWGLVPRENIIGKPLVVFWSFDAPTEDLIDFSMAHNVDVALHFFSETRWDRTFKLIRP
ncbi:MAG: signal peptidase Serine peptidase [Bryobacterales bacterium]|nr:signal peptidase Serine peptidase [Bryobacterales bacterium]